jgi:hypothetical protein
MERHEDGSHADSNSLQLKAKLDAARQQLTTTSGLIRHLLEQHFKREKASHS